MITPTREWPKRDHSGPPCPVLLRAFEAFKPPLAFELLVEYTCFPMDDDTAYDQLMDLICADGVGKLTEYMRACDEKVEQTMRDAAAR